MKRNSLAYAIIFSALSFSAAAVAAGSDYINIDNRFKLYKPATLDEVIQANKQGAGIDIDSLRLEKDKKTNKTYAYGNSAAIQSFCKVFYNGQQMDQDHHNDAYITLLKEKKNVNDYGWPFKYIDVHNPDFVKIKYGRYSDSMGELSTGLFLEMDPLPEEGQMVCFSTNK